MKNLSKYIESGKNKVSNAPSQAILNVSDWNRLREQSNDIAEILFNAYYVGIETGYRMRSKKKEG